MCSACTPSPGQPREAVQTWFPDAKGKSMLLGRKERKCSGGREFSYCVPVGPQVLPADDTELLVSFVDLD